MGPTVVEGVEQRVAVCLKGLQEHLIQRQEVRALSETASMGMLPKEGLDLQFFRKRVHLIGKPDQVAGQSHIDGTGLREKGPIDSVLLLAWSVAGDGNREGSVVRSDVRGRSFGSCFRWGSSVRGHPPELRVPGSDRLKGKTQGLQRVNPLLQIFQPVRPRINGVVLHRFQTLQQETTARVDLKMPRDEKRLPVIFLIGLQEGGFGGILEPFGGQRIPKERMPLLRRGFQSFGLGGSNGLTS